MLSDLPCPPVLCRTARATVAVAAALALAGCSMPAGTSDGDAIAGFQADRAVTLTADVAWVTADGEFMLAIDGRPVPVFTGLRRQPVGPGQTVTVDGWAEDTGRGRILARRITASDGRQIFP